MFPAISLHVYTYGYIDKKGCQQKLVRKVQTSLSATQPSEQHELRPTE